MGLRAKPRRAAQTQQMARASCYIQRLQEHTLSHASRKGSPAAMGGGGRTQPTQTGRQGLSGKGHCFNSGRDPPRGRPPHPKAESLPARDRYKNKYEKSSNSLVIVELIGQRLNVFKRMARLVNCTKRIWKHLVWPQRQHGRRGRAQPQARPSALPSHL